MKRITKLAVPIGIVLIVVMLVVPLPAVLLDLLIAANITVALLVLLTAMFVKRPLDFAAFPSVLLVLTLFRLALNISATRLVLLDGDAGKVIETFGSFVVGGSLIVGIIVFAILVVIQFVVIVKGAERVAEVGARFTLDAMPGKQMAIDADLNAGLIDDDEARTRRREISAEADFYGAMDGASKFVKGDAIAAIVITLVNLIGGFAIGVAQKGMEFSDAIQTYSLLSIGDGLVSQIPALLLSVATGLIVTRATSDDDMGSDILGQLGKQRVPLQVSGVAAIAICLIIPSMPKIPFLIIGGIFLVLATRIPTDEQRADTAAAEGASKELEPVETPESLVADAQVDPIRLDISASIIDLVDPNQGGDLLDRIKALRRKIAGDVGIIMPPVRTKDHPDVPHGSYTISLFGVEVARGQAPSGKVLAVGDNLDSLTGVEVVEPVYGLAGKWISKEQRAQAEAQGLMVIDRQSLVVTHLADIVRRHAHRLLGREEVKMLTDVVKKTSPVVVEELNAQLSLGEVQRVLQGLLAESVPVKDLTGIFEALSLKARESKDPETLLEAARLALGAAVAQQYVVDGGIQVVTFDPQLEQRMLERLRPSDDGPVIVLDDAHNRFVLEQVAAAISRGEKPVVACAPAIRTAVRRLLEGSGIEQPVLSYRELPKGATITSLGIVALPAAALSA